MRKAYFLTILFCLLALPAQASPLTEALQKKYSGMDSMTANFTQTLVHKESGSKQKRTGTLSFKKPLLVRWETKSPTPELLLVGKDAIWNVFPEEEMAYKYAIGLAQDSRSIVRVVTGQAKLDQDFTVEEEGKDGQLVKLRLYPKEPSQAMVEALLWVDPSSYLIRKIRAYDFYGNENEISFSAHNPSIKLPDSSFAYSPPKDFAVEDRTKNAGAAPIKPLMQ